MKTLLTIKCFVEVLAGLALLFIPSTVVTLAFGVPLENSGPLALARVIGAVLLALGIACWIARSQSESRWAVRLALALLVYDVSVVVFLLMVRLVEHMSGIALWPVVGLHSGLAIWSFVCLTKKP